MNEFKRPAWSPDLRRMLVGFVIGLAGAGMIYAAAATAASIIASTFTSPQAEEHSRAVTFAVANAEKRSPGATAR
jgi:hypothetical protein